LENPAVSGVMAVYGKMHTGGFFPFLGLSTSWPHANFRLVGKSE